MDDEWKVGCFVMVIFGIVAAVVVVIRTVASPGGWGF